MVFLNTIKELKLDQAFEIKVNDQQIDKVNNKKVLGPGLYKDNELPG